MGADEHPVNLHTRRVLRGVRDATEKMADEHPLDTLLHDMLAHGWGEDDPMVRWVRQAMLIPYPMTRTEAVADGIITLEDLK